MNSVSLRGITWNHSGYIGLQEGAGMPIVEYCKHRGNAHQVLEQIDALYRASLNRGEQHA